MSGPAAVIYIPLEGPPTVVYDCLTEGDVWRLCDWLNAHPKLLELLYAAQQLAPDLDDLQNAA